MPVKSVWSLDDLSVWPDTANLYPQALNLDYCQLTFFNHHNHDGLFGV